MPPFALLLALATQPQEMSQGFELRQVPVAWSGYRHVSAPEVLAFSADGSLVAAADRGTVWVWAVADAGEKTRIHLPEVWWHTHLAFLPDGKTLVAAGDTDSAMRWFDLGSGKQVRERPLHKPWTKGSQVYQTVIRLGPSGDWHLGYDLIGSEIKAVVWDIATGDRRAVLEDHPRFILQRALPLGDRPLFADLTYATEAAARVWSVTTGKPVGELGRSRHNLRQSLPALLAAAPDGRLVAVNVTTAAGGQASRSHTEVWRADDGRPVASLPDEASSVAFAADGRSLVVAAGNKLRVYDLVTESYAPDILLAGPAPVHVASRDGRTFAVASWPPDGQVGGSLLVGQFPNLPPPLPAGGDLAGGRLAEALAMLASANDVRGRYAVRALGGRPEQALAVLGERLEPDPERRRATVTDLVKVLDDDSPDTRDKALTELLPLAHRFEPLLTDALKAAPPGEVRNRLTTALNAVRDTPAPADLLADLRGVEVLEAVASAEAKTLLGKLAAGVGGSRLTAEAAAALARLGNPVPGVKK